ncbi:transglutaminase-like domain-containing protein [Clostridium sp. BSD9I1]|uniref:transglutaminase-like domain-containing protein n=1 Tax=Clostridium sp. BSD9I1 TaxID=2003589 RepID=UPI00164608F9|nr:transglutaminase-like domain-containing protein [Clostridium sp. BSD9I1]
MKGIKEFSVRIILIYLNFVFIFRVMEVAFKISDFSYVLFSLLFLMVIALVYVFKFLIKKPYIKILLILFIISILSFSIYKNIEYISKLIVKNNSYMQYLNNAIYNREDTEFFQYKILILTLLPLLILICIFFSSIFTNFILIITFAATAFFWYYGYTFIVKKYLFLYLMLTIMTFSINNFLKEKIVLKQKSIKAELPIVKTVPYIVILSLIIASLQSFFPNNYKGHYSEVKDNITNKLLPSKNAGSHMYNISSSGYPSTESKLGGPITLDDREVFKVRSNRPYYLRGSSKDFYDGFSWRNSIDTFEKVGDKNPLPTIEGGRSFFLKTESMENELTIYPTNLYTTTVFSTLYMQGMSINNKTLYINKEGDLLSSKVISTPYTIRFYDDSQKYSKITPDTKNSIVMDAIDFEYKKSYLEGEMENYKRYLELPKNIPGRVYDLTKQITSKDNNDSESLISIYNYLNKNYKYSLEVSNIPQNKEFVDYFLFEEKKGYCTYFATASVVMLRMAGIPARYVEGFNMTNNKNENGLYVVTNKNAHAWVEVLISPTYNTWGVFDAVPSAPEILRTEEEKAKEKESNQVQEKSQEINKGDQKTQHQLGREEKNIDLKGIVINKVLWIVLRVFFVICIFILIKKYRKSKIIKSQSVIPLYQYILSRLKTEGIIIPVNTGDLEFWKSYDDVYIRFLMSDLCTLAYEEYYGQYNSLKALDKISYYNSIEKYLRGKQSKVKYIFFYFVVL